MIRPNEGIWASDATRHGRVRRHKQRRDPWCMTYRIRTNHFHWFQRSVPKFLQNLSSEYLAVLWSKDILGTLKNGENR